MNRAAPSPAQVRARAAAVFRARQRWLAPLSARRTVSVCIDAPPRVRPPMHSETPLSEAEIAHGVYEGLID